MSAAAEPLTRTGEAPHPVAAGDSASPPVGGEAGAAGRPEIAVYWADARDVVAALAPGSIDACVTDPPYALVSIAERYGAADARPTGAGVYRRATAGFMGKRWDTGETAFDPAFWALVLRALKPGAHLVAFGGTRTYHRLACAIEDAGFELGPGAQIRDMIASLAASDTHAGRFLDSLSDEQMRGLLLALDEAEPAGMLAWLYGSGFPKSHDVAKGIDRALGVAGVSVSRGREEPRMRTGTDQNRLGSGRYEERGYQRSDYVPGSAQAAAWEGWGTALKPALEPIVLARKPLAGSVAANVLAHGTGALNVDGCRVASDEQWSASGELAGGESLTAYGDGLNNAGRSAGHSAGRWPANVVHDGSEEVVEAFPLQSGGGTPERRTSDKFRSTYGAFKGAEAESGDGPSSGSAARFFYSAKADAEDRLGSTHPTVKPVDLMAWLCRLVTPPGGVVLDPFAGSGTTGLAALREGFGAVLAEREPGYVADIRRRLAWARGEGRLTAQEMARPAAADAGAGAAPAAAPGDGLPLFVRRAAE